ncbi:11924_t:CDS:10 [Funneliformis geosporum]|uniref:11924_t:CDS:1 n=1 Tax=Funneliformis geosporum TaxID=1117311 RepID=A0A9W4WI87_9GLOM|nr:11924_t:CDS:10 [Funneliformis geosporum]
MSSMSSNGQSASIHRLGQANEQTWLQMGSAAELMQEYDRAMSAYESALRHNAYSIAALSGIAALCRGREQFPRAVDYFQRILNIDQANGEIWGALGHCYLMMDDLQKAYHAYQQALYHLPNPKEPKLWYGIGILYDRYGSLEHAEEAFSQVMRMEPKFEKANEIYFRLGIIYKQQQKYDQSLECFKYILHNPPRPLTEVDIWFQIGHVYEQQKNFGAAKEAYERVLADNPNHAKVLQQLGWLYHQQSASFSNQDLAISYLTKSLESDGNDAQSWYLLGRCYMAQQKYNKAYEAYQQAVYRDGRNPTFWCSIGVLYYQINQFRDALDAYSRAIRLNPFISEVWYDLGTLYESCNNQINDALDAYHRAAELDPANPHIKQRLQMLRTQQAQGGQTTAPIPQDVNPQAYQQSNGPPMLGNPPTFAQPTPGPQGPPGMPTYGSRQENKQTHPPISLSSIHAHGDNLRDLPPMSRGDLPQMQRGDLPPMSAPMSISRRSPVPSGSYAPQPPSHLREPRPPTPPNNQHQLNSSVMSPHDQRPLTPHQSQQSQTPLRSDKRSSPPPTLPQIQDDNRRARFSPQLPEPHSQLRPPYPSSPRINEHGSSQHPSYHQPPHHEISSHSPPIVDRRDSDIYDHNKMHIDYREPPSKPEETPVTSSLDHGSRVSILNNHSQIVEQHDHRMHVDNVSDDKIPPTFTPYRQDDHSIRRSPPIHLPEINKQRPSTVNLESPVRESAYGNDNHSPVSSIANEERKSSIDQHSNRELPKPNTYQEEPQQQQQSSHSPPRSPTLPRIIDNHPSNSPPSTHEDKPILPAIRTSVDRGGPSNPSTRHIDEDYDDTTAADASVEGGASSSTSGQKRSYSSPKSGENEIDERNREDLNKRNKTSSPTPGREDALSPRSTHSEREQRERDQIRERRKSEQSASGSVAQSPTELD